jgi:hypothetical protein
MHVEAVAKPEDYVLFKLDIDNNPVEERIVAKLLASPKLLSLIDEFVWEHHVNFAPMAAVWKQTGNSKKMKNSIEIFATLRRAGIRAHSWT